MAQWCRTLSYNGKIDTFAPFLAEKPSQDDLPKGPEDFLKEITFEGDESFQKKLRELCSEYSGIFSDQLAEKPASLKPFEINIPLELWGKDENRTPVRPQSSTKEVALKENLDEMLASVIERSDAAVAPSGSATPFSRLDAVSTLVPSCSQPRLSVTS